MPPLLSRLLSPSGFGLALLLLLLPFVGVSCSDQELGSLDGSYTGFDLATGGAPNYDANGPIVEQASIEQVAFPDPGVRVLTILVIVLLVAGMGAALLPALRLRVMAGTVIAALAAVFVALVQILAQSNLVDSMQELLLVRILTVPQDLSAVANEEYLSDATGSRIGFWLVLVALVVALAANVMAQRPRQVAQPERNP